MTQDFFLGQLRLILIAVIAFAAGKGWLSTDTTTLLGAVLAPVGLLFGPWLWSIYHNINMKLVPKDSVAIDSSQAAVSDNGTHAVITGATTLSGGTVAKVVGVLLFAFMLSAFLAVSPAMAQAPKLTGNIVRDIQTATASRPSSQVGSGALNDILGALDDKLLPDLQYAKKMADASGSKVTAPCYQAWIDIIQTRQKAVTNADGSPLDLPNPRLITDFEKAVELRNALQPDSDFMRMCSPVANMIKQDMIAFIGKVLAGGAGLATLVPGL